MRVTGYSVMNFFCLMNRYLDRFAETLCETLAQFDFYQKYDVHTLLYGVGQNSIISLDHFGDLDQQFTINRSMRVEFAIAVNLKFTASDGQPVTTLLYKQGNFIFMIMFTRRTSLTWDACF